MAEELLQAKADYKEPEKNWISRFLGRHPTLQAKYNRTLGQDQFLAQNQVIVQDWFNLYWSIKAEYSILDEDTYNMDKMGIAGSSKVVFSKYQKQVSVIEAISITGQ